MERYPTSRPENEPSDLEHSFDADVRVNFENQRPVTLWLRHYDDHRHVVEHTIMVGPDFNANAIYGGLMCLNGRYQEVPSGTELIAVEVDGQWYPV